MTATLAELVAASPSLATLEPALRRAARSDAPILILGEPGSGRTTLARALHAESPRSTLPLVEVDVAVVPSALFESELFGHVAGAFTGAERDRPGRVERAEGGSLVLDQVEELPVRSQAKLLRLLAERRYGPLGGSERRADVRFLAIGATDLSSRVESGAFREDLYYRLEVLAFRLPPLRERRTDLPSLVVAILEELADRHARQVPVLAPSSLEWMRDDPWPGNLRELRNVLERALILHSGGALEVAPSVRAARALPRSLEEVEREAIRRALEFTRGHQQQAADLLGISRKALWQKRKRHGLP